MTTQVSDIVVVRQRINSCSASVLITAKAIISLEADKLRNELVAIFSKEVISDYFLSTLKVGF